MSPIATPSPPPEVELQTYISEVQAYISYVTDVDAFLSSLPPPLPPAPEPVEQEQTFSGSGDCYGGPVSDDIVFNESRGQADAVNSESGAYGCYQIMPFWWADKCSHLDRSVDGQKACAQIILDSQGPSAWGR